MDKLQLLIETLNERVAQAWMAEYRTSRICESQGKEYDPEEHYEAMMNREQAEYVRDCVFDIIM